MSTRRSRRSRKKADGAEPDLYVMYVRSGKTMAQIARDCGLTLSAVSRIIGGHRKPSLESAVSLSRSLAVGIDEVVEAATLSKVKARWAMGLEDREAA